MIDVFEILLMDDQLFSVDDYELRWMTEDDAEHFAILKEHVNRIDQTGLLAFNVLNKFRQHRLSRSFIGVHRHQAHRVPRTPDSLGASKIQRLVFQ